MARIAWLAQLLVNVTPNKSPRSFPRGARSAGDDCLIGACQRWPAPVASRSCPACSLLRLTY